jgi:hypothetical protein
MEFIHPRIPTPEIPPITVQDDILRELDFKNQIHLDEKVSAEYTAYEMKRKLAKRALLRYQHRMTALCDVMDVIDITQDQFDLISPKFKAPPPVPERKTFEQFLEIQMIKMQNERLSIRQVTGQDMDEDEKESENSQSSSPQPVDQDPDEIKIVKYRINKLSTIFPQ